MAGVRLTRLGSGPTSTGHDRLDTGSSY
jgi:hypothetical protein